MISELRTVEFIRPRSPSENGRRNHTMSFLPPATPGGVALDGGSGHDAITFGVDVATYDPAATDVWSLDLAGGSGNDKMEASITDGVDAALRLDGGAGQDTLEGGGGDDWLSGGARADEFVFNTSTDEGVNKITDWEAGQDILNFVGLADNGTVGLADDIDAVSTISDDGTDVVLDLDWGTMFVFEGVGTGSVGSVVDLMNDPLNQLA